MPSVSDINHHREKVVDLTDHFAIKNFVLSDSSLIPIDHPLNEPFIFNGFVFTICLKGEAKLRQNYREFVVREGEIFTYMPNQIFMVKNKSRDLIIEALYLSSDYILQLPLPKDFNLLKRMSIEPKQQTSPEVRHNILEFHSLIAKHHQREQHPYQEPQTKALIYALLMEVSAAYSTTTIPELPVNTSRQEELTNDFFMLMLEHFKRERNVAFYADKLCLTPKYLSMTVKKITGHPISNWINEVVIIEAKRMLKVTDLTALQISEELNFPNPSFFGRFFKQYTGMTPLEYKKK